MNLTLHIWRQHSAGEPDRMVRYEARDINPVAGTLTKSASPRYLARSA